VAPAVDDRTCVATEIVRERVANSRRAHVCRAGGDYVVSVAVCVAYVTGRPVWPSVWPVWPSMWPV
jgi:hypothetical protein